jgi:hypothetical protein
MKTCSNILKFGTTIEGHLFQFSYTFVMKGYVEANFSISIHYWLVDDCRLIYIKNDSCPLKSEYSMQTTC